MESLKILVVDDNYENLVLVKEQFKNKNVQLTCCSTFAGAVELLKKIKPDMLLTDLMMPGEEKGVGGKEDSGIGKPTPYGLVLAIMAKNIGITYVGIVTYLNHHANCIAWAMDSILYNKQDYIKLFSTGDKKPWLDCANSFIPVKIEDIDLTNDQVNNILMIVGGNQSWVNEISKAPELKDYEIDIVMKKEDAVEQFLLKKPKTLLLVGEIYEKASGSKHCVKEELVRLMSMKEPDQKIVVAGFAPVEDKNYLQLPFNPEDLDKKLKEE